MELWAINVREFCLNADIHVTFRDLLHAIKLPHGTDGFTSAPKDGVLRIFRSENPTASAGFEPANLGTKGQHATSRPPKAKYASNLSVDQIASTLRASKSRYLRSGSNFSPYRISITNFCTNLNHSIVIQLEG